MAAWDDSRVAPHVRAAAVEIRDRFGITNIGGFATTGHMPDSDHYTGHALDVMTVIKGQQVANWAQANAQRLSITYIIWNRHIWDSRNGKGWQPYNGTSPHTDHVHISFAKTAGSGGPDVEPGSGAGVTDAKGCLMKLLELINPLA